jgi:hypothetical protein
MRPRNDRLLCAAALLVLPACGFSIAGDAQSNCDRLASIFSELARRCGGHALESDVLRCDDLVLSSITSADVDECQRWAAQVDCASLRTPGWRSPEVCRFQATRLP